VKKKERESKGKDYNILQLQDRESFIHTRDILSDNDQKESPLR